MTRTDAARAAWAVALLLLASSALAQPQAPSSDAELSPEELAEIEEATGADTRTRDKAGVEANEPAPRAGSRGVLQSMNPDISIVTDIAAAAFSSDDHLQTGGHDPIKEGFNLQQVELAIGSSVDPYFRADGYIVFGQEGVEIEEMYATTLALPWNMQARAGQFLTKVGRINSTHPHSWDFVDQPFAIGRLFGPEGNRGLGVELSHLARLPWYVEVIGSVTDASGEGTARSFYGADDLGVDSPFDFQSSLAVKQFFELSDDWSLLTGLSWLAGPNSTGDDNRSDILAADLYLKYRPITSGTDFSTVSLQTETFFRQREVPGGRLRDYTGYAYLFWRFDRRWATARRYEYGSPTRTQHGADAEIADPLDPEWVKSRYRVSSNVTFWPSEFSRIRVQGSMDNPRWRPDPIWAAFLAFEFNIGAHGAHSF